MTIDSSKEILIKTGRVFYGIGTVTYGINQLIHADFRNVFLPHWPSWRQDPGVWAYLMGAALILAGLAIIFNRRAGEVTLTMGVLFLALIVFWQVPFTLFVSPHKITHFGVWAEASKELALSGGAFVVAGSLTVTEPSKFLPLRLSEKLIPFGRIFFSITMTEFGIDHFLYIDFISRMVPPWLPGAYFWTYFGGVALIGSGIAVMLKIKLKLVALLQGLMIFIWFIIIHIPDAVNRPTIYKGNEVVSAADALLFSGVAFIIAFTSPPDYAETASSGKPAPIRGGEGS